MAMRDRSSSRDLARVRVLCVHDTEGTSYTAEGLRDAPWWQGSSHAIADEAGTLLTPAEGCVPYERASWTLRSGNPWSENIELVGYARWTRAEWLARPKMLDACARWLAVRSKARGIPLVTLTPEQYRSGASGIIDHNTHTVGYRDGTHWDVGKGFPWDVVLARARLYRFPPAPEPLPEDEPMILIRNSKGTVMVLAAAFAEYVGTAEDHRELQKVLPQVQLTDHLFDRLVNAARTASADVRAIRDDLADEEPPTPPDE